jgi:hypothetical protein
MAPRSLTLRLFAALLAASSASSSAAVLAEGAPDGGDAVSAARAPAPRTLEEELRPRAFRLWEEAGFGLDPTEHAAWVVAGPSGFVWIPWPWEGRWEKAQWRGRVPAGAVAIVHTHPARVNPQPSDLDRATSERLGVAVYTISRSGIWKAGPDGALTRVRDEWWWAGCRAGRPCPERVSAPLALAEARNQNPAETPARDVRIPE